VDGGAEGKDVSARTNAEDLHGMHDALELYRAATAALAEHQEQERLLAKIRARAAAVLNIKGQSHRQLAKLGGISAPRITTMIGTNTAAVKDVFHAWAKLERTLQQIADRDGGPSWQSHCHPTAIATLQNAPEFDDETFTALMTLRSDWQKVITGQADVTDEESAAYAKTANYVNARMQLVLYRATQKRQTPAETTGAV
jgi:hypothetical protein